MVDLGTGDGAAVLEAARASPGTLCVGMDTDSAAMREASARAARPARRGGLPNALFLAADARTIPPAFAGGIDELHVTLPWGALLRSVLTGDPDLVTAFARGLRPGGRVRVIASVAPRDVASVGSAAQHADLGCLAHALEGAGLRVAQCHDLAPEDMATVRSSWARRLGIPERRPGRLLRAEQPGVDR
jgi:16S rRNA (adenine(1408)-N(1))-methyltransferase